MQKKPKIFIASSSESLKEAEAVNSILDHQYEVTLWTQGTFKLGSTALTDLVKMSSYMDFAIFMFTPDDLALIREQEHKVVRDNVVFELGLFIGALGKERSFVIQPRGVTLHLPSDLIGTTFADYEPDRTDGDISSAMNSPCTKIKTAMDNIGVLNRAFVSSNNTIVSNPRSYEIDEIDIQIMAVCLETRTTSSEGVSFFRISQDISVNPMQLRMSSIKLQRMGFTEVEQYVVEHSNGTEEYLGHKITDLGIDYLLDNKVKFNIGKEPPAPDFDDDIPF